MALSGGIGGRPNASEKCRGHRGLTRKRDEHTFLQLGRLSEPAAVGSRLFSIGNLPVYGAAQYAQNETERAGDENAQHRSLIGLWLEDHRSDETGQETSPTGDESAENDAASEPILMPIAARRNALLTGQDDYPVINSKVGLIAGGVFPNVSDDK